MYQLSLKETTRHHNRKVFLVRGMVRIPSASTSQFYLKDLFIHLRIDPELPYAKRIREEREEQLESRVMGEGYSSKARSKVRHSKMD